MSKPVRLTVAFDGEHMDALDSGEGEYAARVRRQSAALDRALGKVRDVMTTPSIRRTAFGPPTR